jgi:release factor glutamine methyltransferase
MNTLATTAETVRSAAQRLKSYSESPRLDAELLLGKVLGVSRSVLIALNDERITADQQRVFGELIARRADGEPIAYLTGSREFWSLPLTVTPAVLVPRPETECLVERALDRARQDVGSVLDLGTGSGAIALAIASERRHWRITAVDISPQALEVAAQNARALKIANIEWRLGSWFDAVPGEHFDLIVANPPYVASSDPALIHLRAEPTRALAAGATGLEALSAIIAQAPPHLVPQGWLILEHGATQAPQVAQLLEQRGFTSIRTYPDYSGKPRVTLGTVNTQLQEHL